ncbi:hypothetical protein ACIRS1_22150 [Kitasatospora sp. NPDC101176]|uniref:hypothetical protein n=1 Tax=Kitasatospora sp. NPDC101176 TaxID=3364099 RepID=UPI0038183EBD
MAGHFILNNILRSDLDDAQTHSATWGNIQHAEVGWTEQSRKVLVRALNSQSIPGDPEPHNRAGLPPHRYLQWDKTNGDPDAIARWLSGLRADWVDKMKLLRPTGDGLGLTGLCSDAQAAWAAGKINGAISAQFAQGHSLILEIYHLGGKEMA